MRKVIYVLAGMFSLLTAALQSGEAKEKLNVVFFLVDDLGWSDVGYNGSRFYDTPNVDRLAQEGVRFNQAYSASHVCSPTRASILTGKNPARLRLTDWLPGRKEFPFQRLRNAEIVPHLPLEEVTLAEALKEHGYVTGAIGKWHLGEEPSGPLAHGFDVHVPSGWNKGWPMRGYHYPFGFDGLAGEPGDYLTDRLTDEALKFIEKNVETPFFLYLSHFAVHDPIQGRADLVKKYKKRLAERPVPSGPAYILEGNPDARDPLSREERMALLDDGKYEGFRILPDRLVKIKQRQDNPQFAAMVESMDESLGRVLGKLEELGLTDRTVVIFVSDNGGMAAANFGNPANAVKPGRENQRFATSNLPLRGAKGWLYEGGIRVPLVIRLPGKGSSGRQIDVPVISHDFYPTIMELLGLPMPAGQQVDGVSLAPLLREGHASVAAEKRLRDRPLFWHFPHYSNHGQQSPGGAIRVGNYKLLDYFENNSVQLFDIANDPGEQTDLSAEEPDKVRELQARLDTWRNKLRVPMPYPNLEYNAEIGDQWQKGIP